MQIMSVIDQVMKVVKETGMRRLIKRVQRVQVEEPQVEAAGNTAHAPPVDIESVGANAISKPPRYSLNIEYDMVVQLLLLLVVWSLGIMNTELLIQHNRCESLGKSELAWGFGQVLPMISVIQPLTSVVTTFKTFGLRKWRGRTCEHMLVGQNVHVTSNLFVYLVMEI